MKACDVCMQLLKLNSLRTATDELACQLASPWLAIESVFSCPDNSNPTITVIDKIHKSRRGDSQITRVA